MKNYIEPGDTITVPAPAAVNSGDLVIVGKLIGVATNTVAIGVNVAIKTTGVFEFPKVSAEAWTVGAPINWLVGTKQATIGAGALIGVASEPAANPSSVGRVRLNPSGTP
jgi:predicted RecA/RadA family phage recombinase